MEQLERGMFHWDYIGVNRQTAQPQPTKDGDWQFDHEVLYTCWFVIFFYLEIHSLFEDTTVNTEYNEEKVIAKVSLTHWVYKQGNIHAHMQLIA